MLYLSLYLSVFSAHAALSLYLFFLLPSAEDTNDTATVGYEKHFTKSTIKVEGLRMARIWRKKGADMVMFI